LADLELIDAYEFVVQPVLAGHGPTLLADIQRKVALPFRVGRRIPGTRAALTVGDSWDVTAPGEQIDHCVSVCSPPDSLTVKKFKAQV